MRGVGALAPLLRAIYRLPSIRYAILFSLVASIYTLAMGSPSSSYILAGLATLFALSLSHADSRTARSIARALWICGATPGLVRLSLYSIAIVRCFVAVAPLSAASAHICAPAAIAIVIAPLLVSVATEERVVRRL
ncbi:MAG: hypothetical protein GXO32_03855 [Crenarchaeota archaeon]|nr:hypothetical protein [Thermoproteota archaeon]